jgi:phage tail-like protein
MKKFAVPLGLLAAGALLVGSDGASLDGLGGVQAEIIAGGVSMGRFTALSSPTFQVDVIEIVDPMVGTTKVPGQVHIPPLVFEVGYTSGDALAAWRKQVQDTAPGLTDASKSGQIIIFDDAGAEVARWNFENGWPSKLEGFNVARSGFVGRVIDRLELSVDRLVRVVP